LHWAFLDKRRPVLIVSPDYRNEHASDVIVVPSSTRLREAPTHVRLARAEGGVRAMSVLKCEQITTLHKADIEPGPIGAALGRSRMSEVERAILRAIGVPVPLV
jgi:mRNA-degrading endonuclease toxin of MazEF toxin-antitoxin module